MYLLAWVLLFCSLFTGNCEDVINTQSSDAIIPSTLFGNEKIIEAAKYPGPNFEEKLKRLLKVDLHYAQALYYLHQEQSGFMAQERFERAHDRGIADIREASKIKDDDARIKAALNARSSWLEGFRRARFRDKPVR
ncbi:MAG: hypothetical protein CMM87_00235 [Rickettsiales bacterium]|nr:hypothetical protein [Rickettsiales bacterium]|tara:strand:- start:26825 stop:27232 length:408 start_codon:yes stop_codon:yes gene_type:complete